MNNKFWGLIIGLCTIFATSVSAQVNAPFSRFGIGQQQFNPMPLYRSMGNTSIGFRSYDYLNPSNPASYSVLYQEIRNEFYERISRDTIITDAAGIQTRIVVQDSILRDTLLASIRTTSLEVGITGNLTTTRVTNNYSRSGDASLGYISLGIPIPRFGGFSVGLMPFSEINYNIEQQLPQQDIGTVILKHVGTGGIYKTYFGLAYQYRNFSVGANASYLFGNMNVANILFLPQEVSPFGTREQINHRVRGFQLDGGLQYQAQLSPNLFFRAGLVGNLPASLAARTDTLYDRGVLINDEFRGIFDTIRHVRDISNQLTLPAGAGIGFMLERTNSWLIGLDIKMEQWSGLDGFLVGSELNNVLKISAGGQYIPNLAGNFFERNKYRLGIYYYQTSLIINNPVDDYGITFGFGIPVRRARGNIAASSIDLALQFGSRGAIAQNNITENYFQFGLGFNLNDNTWLFRPRFY